VEIEIRMRGMKKYLHHGVSVILITPETKSLISVKLNHTSTPTIRAIKENFHANRTAVRASQPIPTTVNPSTILGQRL